MSVIVEFTVSASEFVLAETLRSATEIVVEVERVVAHPDGGVTPYFWVSEGDHDRFETSVHEDPSVANVRLVDQHDAAVLYRADLGVGENDLMAAFEASDAVILEASGRAGEWRLRVRFDDRGRLGEFTERTGGDDVSVAVERIYQPDQPKAGGRFGLTPTQRETLVEAEDAGYYDSPRGITHADLAERMGVSQQAVSERLHRAHGTLVREALTVTEPDVDPAG